MTQMSLADRFFVDAMSAAFREDPYPYYETYRGRERLLRVDDTIWLALGHADVTAMLRHPKLSSNESRATTEAGCADSGRLAGSLLFMDPPDHTRLRRLVACAFTPKRVADLRPTDLRACDARARMAATSIAARALFEIASISVVISDISLPGEDGCAFIGRVRATAKGAHVPAIALSGYRADDDARARAGRAGSTRTWRSRSTSRSW